MKIAITLADGTVIEGEIKPNPPYSSWTIDGDFLNLHLNVSREFIEMLLSSQYQRNKTRFTKKLVIE